MSEISCGVMKIDERLAQLLSGGFELTLLSRPFKLALAFVGPVQVVPRGTAFGFTGRARLSVPFELEAPVDLEIDPTGAHRLRFAVPELTRVVERHVRGSLGARERAQVDTLVRPYLDPLRDCAAVLASHAGDEPGCGPVVAGINFFKAVRLGDVEPTRALVRSFPAARLEEQRFTLRLACVHAPGMRLEISAATALAAALGTPAVVLDRVALRIDEHSSAIANSLTTGFTVRVGGETLVCAGVTRIDGPRATLCGRLDARDAAWNAPLGATGLTIAPLEIRVDATPTAPFVALDLRGPVRIGGEPLPARLALRFDPADPARAALQVASGGMELRRLLAGLTAPEFIPDELPRLPLADLMINVAPYGGTIAGQTFAQGLALAGEVDLWGFQARLAGRVDFASGGSLHGSMSALRFPDSAWLLNIHGEGAAGPSIAIDFNNDKKGARVVAAAKLVAIYDQSIDLTLTPDVLRVELTRTKMGIYTGGRFEVGRGALGLDCAARFDHGLKVMLGRHAIEVALDVGASLEVRGDASRIKQTLRFDFDACGARMQVVTPDVQIPLTDLASLQKFFADKPDDQAAELIRAAVRAASLATIAWLTAYLPGPTQIAAALHDCAAACEAAAAGLRTVCKLAADACAIALKAALYPPQQIATSLRSTYEMTEREVGLLLKQTGMSAGDIATALHRGFGWSAKKTAEYFDKTLHIGDKATQKALAAANYTSKQIEGAMRDVFGWAGDVLDTVTGIF